MTPASVLFSWSTSPVVIRVRIDIKDLADPFYLNSLGEIDW